ncbi:HlyD family secretion protein [Anaerolinea thermophila]|uniref:Secretion protein HlyD family protein n=1 Tax=Anaerolinea thermophila (strain DSM 14523 / JCM 11388 / NBRC 100420 / UNI-1) TaxID=926569 RepID=E8MZ02_ANATU|nr:efflux RND transporter periplasmic adaptor subunit [Anaerolinea thermophila]BAJ62145.1 secretion protein HlyD family protein [Anaerolinea thermophila UNI-1]
MTWKKSILSAVIVLWLAGCSALPWAQSAPQATPVPTVSENGGVLAEAKLVPNDSASLFFLSGGTLAEVLVSEGEQVQAGQVLARLSESAQAQATLAQAKAELLAAQQALDTLNKKAALTAEQARVAMLEAEREAVQAWQAFDRLDTRATRDRIDDLRERAADLQQELQDREETLGRYSNLAADNPTRKRAEDDVEQARLRYNDASRELNQLTNEVELARARWDLANQRLEDARRTYEARQELKPDPDELALAQARVEAAQAAVAAAKEALSRLELRAPFDGTVVEVRYSPGESVAPAQTVLVLADLSEWYAETVDLSEKDVVKIKAGQAVEIIPDALPEVTLKGEVERIALFPLERGGDVVYRVRVRLLESDERLRWGMTVDVRFPQE